MPHPPARRAAPARRPARGPARPRQTKAPNRKPADIRDLLAIMRRLRAPGGCPWDREQTLDSLQQYLVEECYEVLDALESGDPARHAEELGDLLLQVVFHAQIRRERGEFDFSDVVRGICDKLIRRHPHVFHGLRVSGSAEVLRNWDAIKAGEKAAGAADDARPPSVIGSIPRHLPALHKAHHVQKRVARVGFDWTAVHDVIAKIEEELGEVREALAKGDAAHVKEEVGDLLFAVANLSRFQGINPEEALNRTVAKFTRRFQAMEAHFRGRGRRLADCSLSELDAAWNAVKAEE